MRTIIQVDRKDAPEWSGDVPVLIPEGTLLRLPGALACRVRYASLDLRGPEPVQMLVVE